MSLKSALLLSMTAAYGEGEGGEGCARRLSLRWSTVVPLEPSVCLWLTNIGGGEMWQVKMAAGLYPAGRDTADSIPLGPAPTR